MLELTVGETIGSSAQDQRIKVTVPAQKGTDFGFSRILRRLTNLIAVSGDKDKDTRTASLNSTFKTEQIDLADLEKSPLELQYLVTKYPDFLQELQQLAGKGVQLSLVRRVITDEEVLRAISRIAVTSQENFIRTWLPDLIEKGTLPRLTISARGIERAKAMRNLLTEQESALGGDILRDTLRGDVEIIQKSVDGYLLLTPTLSVRGDETVQKTIAKLNSRLAEVKKRYAIRKMMFDNARSRTKEGQDVIKMMPAVGVIAHSLEIAGLGVCAKLIAASSDDLLGEFAEFKALLGTGFTLREVINRLQLAAPVFVIATMAAQEVEGLLSRGQDVTAGALFGASAVALSLLTTAQSIRMYFESYNQLVKEGKIPGATRLPTELVERFNRPDIQKILSEFNRVKGDDIVGQLCSRLEGIFEDMGYPQETIRTDIIEPLSRLNTFEIQQIVQSQSARNKLIEAMKQDFSNPVRMGVLVGSTTAPLAGVTAGITGGLHNGFVEALIGSSESLLAWGTVMGARKISDMVYKLELKREIQVNQKAKRFFVKSSHIVNQS